MNPLALAAVLAVNAAVDDWHDAAAKADEARYFGHFAAESVFLGTDATERWDLAAFRAYAHPFFSKGKAWTLKPSDRHVSIAPDAAVAWFDETVTSPSYGPSRGSGVLLLEDGKWRIAHYNLTVPIPNDLLMKVAGMIAHGPRQESRDVSVKEAAVLLRAHAEDPSFVVLDVRTPAEHAQGRIHGSVNLDFNAPDFKDKAAALDKDKTYLLHCAKGGRSAKGARLMRESGFKSVLNMEGGLGAWAEQGNPVER